MIRKLKPIQAKALIAARRPNGLSIPIRMVFIPALIILQDMHGLKILQACISVRNGCAARQGRHSRWNRRRQVK